MRVFRRVRRSAALQMIAQQRRTIAALCARLDAVQRDAEAALEAQTEADSRIADLERLYFGPCTAGRLVFVEAVPESNQ